MGGEGANHTTTRKPVLCKTFNTLCFLHTISRDSGQEPNTSGEDDHFLLLLEVGSGSWMKEERDNMYIWGRGPSYAARSLPQYISAFATR